MTSSAAFDEEAVRREARSIVSAAKKSHTLETLTRRLVRDKIADTLSIDREVVNQSKAKSFIKDAIDAAIAESEASSPVRPVASPKGKKRKSEEQGSPVAKKSKKSLGKGEPPKAEEKKVAEDMDVEGGTNKEVATAEPVVSATIVKNKEPTVDDTKSDSELSVLIDDEPVPKKKKKGKAKQKNDDEKPSKAAKKAPKPKKEKEPQDEDEKTIKQLKSYVVACGVRKIWSKEFKDLTKPSQQIARLKILLTELGMSGRMSLEKAKAIRARRELAQEAQDALSFEQRVIGKRKPKSEEASEEDEEGPKKAKGSASRSIMEFIQGQSSDEN